MRRIWTLSLLQSQCEDEDVDFVVKLNDLSPIISVSEPLLYECHETPICHHISTNLFLTICTINTALNISHYDACDGHNLLMQCWLNYQLPSLCCAILVRMYANCSALWLGVSTLILLGVWRSYQDAGLGIPGCSYATACVCSICQHKFGKNLSRKQKVVYALLKIAFWFSFS